MLAHSQYCQSGDHTIAAAESAIKEVYRSTSDANYVFVVSDANLERYGIDPQHLGNILTSSSNVNAHAIFIASIGNEAAMISKSMPIGSGYVCLDTTELPMLFKKLLSADLSKAQ